MNTKNNYQAPEVEILDVQTEGCIATSFGDGNVAPIEGGSIWGTN